MNLVGNICQQASQNILQMSVFHWIVSTVVEEKKNGKIISERYNKNIIIIFPFLLRRETVIFKFLIIK